MTDPTPESGRELDAGKVERPEIDGGTGNAAPIRWVVSRDWYQIRAVRADTEGADE